MRNFWANSIGSETSGAYFTQGISSSSKQGIRGVMIFDTQTARSVGPQGYIFVDTPLCGQIVRVADYTARNIGAGGCRPKVPLTAGMALRRKEWETIPDIFAAEKERSTHPTSERPGRRYVLHFTANPITNSLQRKPRSRLRKSIRCHLDGL
jgi:hypothetical protein